jgi:hypothetical protein
MTISENTSIPARSSTAVNDGMMVRLKFLIPSEFYRLVYFILHASGDGMSTMRLQQYALRAR